ncbi:MAG: FG-GAP repeat domain-containing protein, partial [Planctomycetota bacterium]
MARSGVVAIVIALAAGAGIGGWALCSRDPSPARPSEFVAAPQVIEQDFEASEAIAGAIQASLRARFLEPLRRRDWNRLTQAFADDFEAMLPAAEGAQRGAGPLFVVTRRKLNAPEDARLEAAGFVDHLKTMTQDLAVLERAKLQTWESLASPGGEQARVRLHVTLGGERTDGTRAAIHLDLMAGVVREGPEAGGAYRLRRLAADSIERVEALSPPLREVTDATGFHFNTSESNQGLEQSLIDDRRLLTTGGLTVADWNGDGFPDAFASVAGKRSVLFQNDGRGGFVRFEHPIPAAESPAFALLLDLDGDGTEELTTSHVLRYEGSRAFFPIYRRDSAGAWQRSAAHELSADVGEGVREFNVQGITAADLDRDGDLDLFFSAYSTSLSHRQDYNRVDARDGARNLLFVNEGGLRFVEDARARGITGTQYTYVAQIFDVTGDGNLDLLCGNDFGLNRLFAGRGDGTFEDQPAHPIVR